MSRNHLFEQDLFSVKHDGRSLQTILNRTDHRYSPYGWDYRTLCIAAVQKTPDALQFVKNQRFGIGLAAVRQDGMALRFVQNQTLKICREAVQQDPRAIRYVKELLLTLELCLFAVQNNGSVIFALKKEMQTPEMCLAAIIQNGNLFKYYDKAHQTFEICLEAVKQNSEAIKWIKDKEMRALVRAIIDRHVIELEPTFHTIVAPAPAPQFV